MTAPCASRDERTLVDTRPPVRSILVGALQWLVILGIVALAGAWVALTNPLAGPVGFAVFFGAIGLAIMLLLWRALDRDCRRYTLTTRHAFALAGVIRTVHVGVPLEKVHNVVVLRTLVERLLCLGTVAILSANGNVEVSWWAVSAPDRHARLILKQLRRARAAAGVQPGPRPEPISRPMSDGPNAHHPTHAMPVIGIAGGIGSGKSTVAKAFESLNCFVIDSDARAKAALDRPEVRDQLVAWWGGRVLASDGRVDRSAVASIIFSDADQRKRLEAVVHPIVRQDRARMIQEARAAKAQGVIVDAPLLFEAGIGAECDAVVFVDVPREERLRRVREARGWDDAELSRREASQLPLQEKRQRCRFVIDNSGTRGPILQQADAILRTLQSERGRRATPET